MKTLKTSLVAVALVLAACSSKPVEKPEMAGSLETIDMGNHPPMVKLADPETNQGHVGRKPRRITVAQLRESILTTTGRQWSQINNLAASLGQADYALTVSESTEANLVFAKFLEDGAREVCLATANADLNNATAATRVLFPNVTVMNRDFTTMTDAQVQDNLQYLAVRFWGQRFNDDEVGAWTQTFRAIATRAKAVNQPAQAWGAMCVAFMTDPRFITY
ncbi:MAG: hypothetical protein SFW67_28155 [Myxococcaceae bacterium]|nr:hypothetical protein [Myxococcaceae bacterium]